MKKSIFVRFVLFAASLLFMFPLSSQTLIINEVSNGADSSKEWVELVVMDTTVVYSCNPNALPPSIDIRGWIIDDNSGYHGTGVGVAAGCNRFSFDPMWAAVPVGTIIVIYNNADKDPSIPPDDLSMSDGNCRIIAPINNTTLFERNATTPGAIACSYPMTGWLAGGIWNYIVLANSGDCMRIVNTSGCEVFSVAYTNANQNTMIYFSSGTSGANNVWYFNNGDPFLQANWSEGCTNVIKCGSNVQTPGLPNNAANQAFINSLNNSCTPIPALSLTPAPVVNAQCGCNGSASVTASGSIPGYTYVWTPTPPAGQGTPTASGLCPGTYKCVVTSYIGCQDSLQFTIAGSVAIDASVSGTNVLCYGDSSATALANFSGGNGGVTFSWSPAPGSGQGTGNVSGLTAQSYTVTVSDAASCSDTAIFAPVQPPKLQITFSITPASCFGFSNGAVNITTTGGVPAYNFLWSNGATTEDISNLLSGQFAFTVYDANNCVIRDTFVVTEPQQLSAIINSTPLTCNNNGSGAASVSVTGGTPGYVFNWQPSGGTNSSAVNLSAGSYTCTINDANLCSTTVSTGITEPTSLTVSVTTTGAPCGGNSGSATATASGGTAGYTYSWQPGNASTPTAGGLSAGIYTVIVNDANNCADTLTATVPNINGPSISIVSTSSVTCFGLSNGSAEAATSGGTPPLTIVWSPSGGTTVIADSLSAGAYLVTATDSNGCIDTINVNITQPPALTTTVNFISVLCNGNATGAATAVASGGNGNYNFNWIPFGGNLALADSLTAGNYSVIVSDVNNCTDTATITITEPSSPLTMTTSALPTTCGLPNGTASAQAAGGSPGYQYSWSPGNFTADTLLGIPSGNYTCTITDLNNCVITQTVSVGSSSNASVTISTSSNVSCFGLSNGSASVLASGVAPLSYSWTPSGGNGTTATGLSDGTYTCIVTDNNNCVDSVQVTISEPLALNVASSFTNAACFGQASGSATAQVSGGTTNYSYNWSPSGGNNASATNLNAGTYTCIVTDANNCQDSISVSISQPTALTVNLSTSLVNCFNTTGSILTAPSGGTPGYTYQWSPVGSGNNPSGLNAGTYTLTLTDSLGCIVTQTVNITSDTVSPIMNAGPDDTLSCLPGSSLSLSGTTTTVGVTYVWNGPNGFTANLPNPFINQPGTYTFTVTNPSNGCSSTDVVVISQQSGPTATIIANPNSGTAPLLVNFNSGPSTNSSYNWSFGNGNTSNLNSDTTVYLNPGSYTVTLIVTNSIGCTDTATQVIFVNEPFSILIPNVFTPNGDGNNDVFFIPSTGLRMMELQIFDRWGLPMTKKIGMNDGWDGKTQNGETAPDGTYYFILQYEDLGGKEGNSKGYLLLAR